LVVGAAEVLAADVGVDVDVGAVVVGTTAVVLVVEPPGAPGVMMDGLVES
jgi:hypothetical protein